MAQTTPPKLEARAAWIATVINLDWPKSPLHSPATQQADLRALMDGLAARNINVVYFQVRSEADAMYASEIEPWSRYLTGQQGQAPSPIWDPLSFAIETAHERGMELHAWVNPFRAVRQTNAYPIAANHVSTTHPEWILEIGTQKMLDPGHPAVRDYVIGVVEDILRRYDVDGIHFDDYFYPYSPQIGDQDRPSFETYNPDGLQRGDWRRQNINRFMADVYAAVLETDAEAQFGVSPFGIWKSGTPAGTSGLDAYSVIYADPLAWLADESVDYLIPQLYWPFGGGQDFGTLATWWAQQAGDAPNPRPIYTGHGTYKSDAATTTSGLYAANEMPRQIRFTRTNNGIHGSAHFRAANLLSSGNQGLTDSLRTDLYRTVALRPPMTHRDMFPPAAPDNLTATLGSGSTGSQTVLLRWDPSFFGTLARRFAVYRVKGSAPTDVRAVTNNPENLVAVTYEPLYSEGGLDDATSYHYIVTALTFNNVESGESSVASVMTGTNVAGMEQPLVAHLNVWPNPASTRVNLSMGNGSSSAGRIRTLVIHSAQGREVARLAPGTLSWDLTDRTGRRVAAGIYFVSVRDADGRTLVTKPVTIVRP
ncbi:MAG: family 10 glycosylhydrolase [Rhodothermales bacterium]